MDLRQTKLTKNEWDALEVPVPKQELTILKMIYSLCIKNIIHLTKLENLLVSIIYKKLEIMKLLKNIFKNILTKVVMM